MPTAQGDRLAVVLAKKGSTGDTRAFFDELIAALGPEATLQPDACSRLQVALRSAAGFEHVERLEEHLRFWQAVAARYPDDAWVRAVYADTLIAHGPVEEGFDEMLRAVEMDPALLSQFGADLPEVAASLGPTAVLRHRLACLGAAEARRPVDRELVAELRAALVADFPSSPEVRELLARR